MEVLCSRCDFEVPPGTLGSCPECGGILQPRYSADSLTSLRKVPLRPGLDGYRALLPIEGRVVPYLGEGATPLVRVSSQWGLDEIYLKLEGTNPSGSFKDRPASLALGLALEASCSGVLTASSGNAGSAIAAYAAAEGLPCLILLEPDNPPNKTRQILRVGAKILPVHGIFQHPPMEIAKLLRTVADRLGYYLAFVWAPVNPYLLEGIKSISYEVVARLSEAPGMVISPVGGGDLLVAQWRGYLELRAAGVIAELPRMVAVQSTSAAPLLRAFEGGTDDVPMLESANSQISGINVAFSGAHALAAVRDSDGSVIGVSDEEIFEAQRRLAREQGVWVEPAGAASVAAVAQLVKRGVLAENGAPVVCILSGAGFKDQDRESESMEGSLEVPSSRFNAEDIVHRIAGLSSG